MLTRCLLVLLAVSVGALFVAAPAAKAAVKAATGGEVAKTADAVPEKDPTAFIDFPKRWDLTIYTLVVFLLLFLILYKFAWPNISAGLQKREEMLSAVKDAAEKAKREAEEMHAKLQAEFATANDKVRAMLEEARRDADSLRVKERAIGQKEAQDEREKAKREIETAKEAALQEIYIKSVDLATLISSKAVRRNMTADDHRRLVDESLAELKTASRN